MKTFASALLLLIAIVPARLPAAERPHIIFVMADDMGWGQTGYRGHPVLKTPNLDAMAAAGLRFERFYAGGPVCSPTRATVMTGRTHDRCGVLTHGYALRLQEKTIAQALKTAGYVTGHFGKWHLNGFKGPGAPVLAEDPRRPGKFGFDDWVSVTNFFDQNPLMSRRGNVEQFEGDSSEVTVAEAVKFLEKNRAGNQPMFAVVWFGSPHSPYKALDKDKAVFTELNDASANHYGELVALDRSIGTLRAALRRLNIADNTMLVFCSDNGGLPEIKPDTVGGLRGNKGSVYEGGIRVPGIIEWPATIQPRITNYPACTMDLFPTVADIVGLPSDVFVQPIDGISLEPLLKEEQKTRNRPIGFHFNRMSALIDGRYKILTTNRSGGQYEMYDLETDLQEAKDLGRQDPERFERLKTQLIAFDNSVAASFAGQDYPERRVEPADPPSIAWSESPLYQPYLRQWRDRWEYNSAINSQAKAKKTAKQQK